MTICLASICRDGDSHFAVVAADRMVTLGNFMEFEHGVPKMAHPSSHAVVMVAGDTLVGTRLAREVSEELNGTSPRTPDVAKRLATRYQEVRQEAVANQVLAPRGLSLPQFYGGHASFNPQITMMIDQALLNFNLGIELLLAGVDQDGAHIFSVHNPGGTELQHDVIGYGAIGSGAIHAIQSMVGFGHVSSAGLRETIFRTYASKRRAEVAPGVGLETDMAIISLDGVAWVSQDNQKHLGNVYTKYLTAATNDLAEQLATLRLDEPEETAAQSAEQEKHGNGPGAHGG